MAPIPQKQPNAPDADLTGVTILAVEDHADSLDLLLTILGQLGATVIPAGTASAAFELLKVHRPHVIVSDIGLPDEDGLSLMRRVRSLPASDGGATPAIALTALRTEADRARGFDAGFHAYLTKPVEVDHLIHAVAAMTRRLFG